MDAKTEKQLMDLWRKCDASRQLLIAQKQKQKLHTMELVRQEMYNIMIENYVNFQNELKSIIDGKT